MLASLLGINKLLGILPNASDHGRSIDFFLEVCHDFMAVLFVGWTIYFFYTICRFHRSRNPKANYFGVQSKASAHLEFMVVLIEAALLLGFALPLWGHRVGENQFPTEDNPLRVHAVAQQFQWNFHYPGPDGVFGRQSPEFVTASNPLGLDPNDPAGQDDLVTPDLHLVNRRATVIEVTSKDVIHGLALEHMRMSQDAIPGSRIPMWFRPIVAGEYEIICSQLCGTNHYQMRATMTVEDDKAFETWMKETSDLQHPAKAAAPAPAAASAAPAPAAPAATAPAAPAPAPAAPAAK